MTKAKPDGPNGDGLFGHDSELDAELDRRLAAHEANPEDVRTWDQIMARLRAGRQSRDVTGDKDGPRV